MLKLISIFDDLKNNSSKIGKEEILKLHINDEELKEVLHFLYNPFIVTGISSKKIKALINRDNINLSEEDEENNKLNNLSELMTYLKVNNSGRHLDVFWIKKFIWDYSSSDKEGKFIEEIATKSLKVGITSKTVNKVFGKNFIPEFDVMLAKKYSEHEKKVKDDFILTDKLDGIRAILTKENGSTKLFSRQGQPHLGFVEIENEALTLPDNIVLDGEFILKNINNLNSADLYRETVKVVRKDGEKKDVEFHVFDMMPIEDFKNGICKTHCIERKNKLSDLINNNDFKFIKEVKLLYVGKDKYVINKYLDQAISQEKEGIMLNIANAPYVCKRTDNILKIKKMHTVDLQVIGFEEGEGKYAGSLGRMNVNYKGFTVGVGSGFTDEQRTDIWNNKDKYISEIAEIQYFEESNNQDGGISLRFPVFKSFRFDKYEESYN